MIPDSLFTAASFTPNSLQSPNAWVGHLPFAAWIIQEISPKIFVELGTHSGNSYFSFCQAVVEVGLSSKCYAVDTWQGDEHAGRYSDDVFTKVNTHNQEHYAEFSQLLKTTFDDAAAYFSDESIDLLHIDGLHTYEAVRHDFETWLPKLAPGAVVMFHDTNVRERGFGVWKLWEELQAQYHNNLEFVHSHGLGVLQVNGAPDNKKLHWLQPNSPAKRLLISYFSALGSRQLERFELGEIKRHAFNLKQAVAERDGQITALNQVMVERDEQIVSMNQAIVQRENRVSELEKRLSEQEHVIAAIRSSASWRLTAPLRLLAGAIKTRIFSGNATVLVTLQPTLPSTAPSVGEESCVSHEWESHDSPSFEALSGLYQGMDSTESRDDPTRLIAFYLPQYHRIPENSEWWGPGFTEWTNVVKGRPNYAGHYQPHMPRELGFYDLSSVEVMREQVELAKLYGVSAFCFYHYWFSGRRILERPVENFLRSDIDFPYCLCWANENWTRTWDGDTRSILMEQKYLDTDPHVFITSLLPHFHDKRYLRVDGKPMLLVYRAKDIPSTKEVFRIWRDVVMAEGFVGLHIVVVDFYDITRPEEVSADALVEFPPHKFNGPQSTPDRPLSITNPDFKGGIVDYAKMMIQSANRQTPGFTLYRGILPSWDNTARRQNTSTVVHGSSPELFGTWLRYIRAYTRETFAQKSDPFVFVNAWNEWGEGCHLEPDQKWGLRYLDAIKASSTYCPAIDTVQMSYSRLLAVAAKSIANRDMDLMDSCTPVEQIREELRSTKQLNGIVQKTAFFLRRFPHVHRLGKSVYQICFSPRAYNK